MCSPTRGQLLTGLSALRNGATSVTAGRTFLRPGIPTIAGAFAGAGYATGIFGKWHLGDFYPHRPIDKGFQKSIYHLGWGQLHSTPEFDWPLIDGRYFDGGVEKRYQGHCTDFWFDSVMAWMKECRANNKPFLCYLPTNAPHAPHIDLDEYIQPYQGKGPAGFFGMIAHIDKRFGDLERFLASEGLKENTIVVFMTDNGGTAGVSTHNAGLRAGKTTYYDGGHRVPCWIRWPNGNLGEPRDINTPAQNTDLLPTLCELCGIAPPTGNKADDAYRGTSLANLLRGMARELPDHVVVLEIRPVGVLIAEARQRRCARRDRGIRTNGDGDVENRLCDQPRNSGASDVLDADRQRAQRVGQFRRFDPKQLRPEGRVLAQPHGA